MPVPCISPILTQLSGHGAVGIRGLERRPSPKGVSDPRFCPRARERAEGCISGLKYRSFPVASPFLLSPCTHYQLPVPKLLFSKCQDKSRTSNSSLPLRNANTPFSFSQAPVLRMLPGNYHHCHSAHYPVPVTDYAAVRKRHQFSRLE